jgi:hypothetical protein
MRQAKSADAFKRFEVKLSLTAAIFGTLGRVEVPELLMEKYGEKFSLFSAFNSVFMHNSDLCRISILSVPTVEELVYLRNNIDTFCMLCDTARDNWESYLEVTWAFLLKNEFLNLVVLLTSSSELNDLLQVSESLRDMNRRGVKLFALTELSEDFINNFFYGIVHVGKVSKGIVPPEETPQASKQSRCLLM